MPNAPRWPDRKGKFDSLTAQFDHIKDRFWATSDLEERAALVEQLNSILQATQILVQEQVNETSKYSRQIARQRERLLRRQTARETFHL